MDKLRFFFALLSSIAVVFAQDEIGRLCKDVTRQTCNGFQQCCSRRCAGPHQTTCTESGGRMSQASCQCEGSGSDVFPGSGGHSTDFTSTCGSHAQGSCRSFKDCCFNRCARPTRMACSSVGSRITGAECVCPAGSTGGIGPSIGGSHRSGGISGNTLGGQVGLMDFYCYQKYIGRPGGQSLMNNGMIGEEPTPEFRPNTTAPRNDDDPKTWLPFRVLYLPDDDMEPADLKALKHGFEYVNEKFQRILKGSHLYDIRVWNRMCGHPVKCGGVLVPTDFLFPCDEQAGTPPSDRVKQYTAEGYNLVIYVALDKYTINASDCVEGMFAFITPCRFDSFTQRRIHAGMTFCRRPSNLSRDHMEAVMLHETLHAVVGDLVGIGSKPHNPYFDEYNYIDRYLKAENHTWRRVNRQWKTASGVRDTVRYLSILPTVLKAAKEHFKCDSIEGAELQQKPPNADNPQGPPDLLHWSERLFADEQMSPAGAGGNKLSVFTLGVMQDSGWYEVDMSAAEPLTVSPPDKDHGCDVARKSCHEIVEEAAKDKKKVQLIAPYCDSSTNDPVLTPLCSKDGAITLTCQGASRTFQDGCDVLQPNITDASFYTDAVCEKANLRKAAEDLQFGPMGLAPGSGTRCVTFYNFHKQIGKTSLHPVCMQSECQDGKIVFKFNQNGCQIECPPGSSNKLHTSKRSAACHDNVVEELEYVCPDMDCFSCPHKIASTAVATSSMTSTTSGSSPITVELASVSLLVSVSLITFVIIAI